MFGFTISIVAGHDKASSSVRVDGSVEHLITDEERLAFGLSEPTLNEAITEYHNLERGRSPKGIYLRDPTPKQGELFKENGWSEWQTKTTVVATSVEILEFRSNPMTEPRMTYSNDTSRPASHTFTWSGSAKNRVRVAWKKCYRGGLSVEEKVKYSVGSLGSCGGGEPSIDFSSSWYEDEEKCEDTITGTQSPVPLLCPPHSHLYAEIFGIQTIMKVRITYTASLKSGSGVVLYYKKGYQGHKIWRSPLLKVMAVSQIPNSIETTQEIDIMFHAGDRIEIRDSKTEELLYTHYRPESIPGNN